MKFSQNPREKTCKVNFKKTRQNTNKVKETIWQSLEQPKRLTPLVQNSHFCDKLQKPRENTLKNGTKTSRKRQKSTRKCFRDVAMRNARVFTCFRDTAMPNPQVFTCFRGGRAGRRQAGEQAIAQACENLKKLDRNPQNL